MVDWKVWLHPDSNGSYHVMIRNHKTSRSVGLLGYVAAQEHMASLQGLPWQSLAKMYKQAIAEGRFTFRDDQIDLTRPKPYEIRKGEKCYAVIVTRGKHEFIVRKEKLKKDAKAWLDSQFDEYTLNEFLAKVDILIARKKEELLRHAKAQ
jgi:hypothetical protein